VGWFAMSLAHPGSAIYTLYILANMLVRGNGAHDLLYDSVQIVINKLSILLNLLIGLDQTLNKSNKFLRPVILSLRLWSVDTHGEEPLGNNISQHFRINVDLSTFTTEDNILD
jgi:hypothetical protein